MRYFQSYRFAFESPKWPIHLLIGFGCQLVPIVGHMVLMGYIYDVVEARLRHGRDHYPDFNFDRLGAYLTRGVHPFLVTLVAAIPGMVLIAPFFIAFAVSTSIAERSNGPRVLTAILLVVGIGLFLILMTVLTIVIKPVILRAGLSQDFGSAFSIAFVKDFLGRVWKELVLAILFIWVTAPFVMFAGLLAFCVGIYAAAIVVIFAQTHLEYQLYQLYLERGGAPIPFKEPYPGVPPRIAGT